MRWKSPKIGDLRIAIKFLFLPKTIDGETRWLERATWEQRYFGIWLDKRWVNN